MNDSSGVAGRGVAFVRDNPQLLYTLFLLIAIPVAFFVTSDRFLSVARENQDRLERSRVTLLQDAIAEFAADYREAPEILEERISAIVAENQPIMLMLVLSENEDGTFAPVAQSGSERFDAFAPDAGQAFLLAQSRTRSSETFLMERFEGGERYWDAARSVNADGTQLYLYSRLSMANVDAIAERGVRNAYIVLFVIIALVFLLLLRQAKVVDYAALYRKLKEVDAMKDDFVSMAAHELRSPLTIIRGYVDLLMDEKLPDEAKKTMGLIDSSAEHLNLMVGDILDVAKLQEGRMSFSFVKLDPVLVVREVVDSFRSQGEKKGLALSVDAADVPPIEVDANRFRQVLINLVGNAVKYTMHGSVTAKVSRKENGVEIRVSDTGIGISAEDQQRLFGKFFRVKSDETTRIPGTGLGLWITKEIVRQMRGIISVESIKGKGTDFVLVFQVRP